MKQSQSFESFVLVLVAALYAPKLACSAYLTASASPTLSISPGAERISAVLPSFADLHSGNDGSNGVADGHDQEAPADTEVKLTSRPEASQMTSADLLLGAVSSTSGGTIEQAQSNTEFDDGNTYATVYHISGGTLTSDDAVYTSVVQSENQNVATIQSGESDDTNLYSDTTGNSAGSQITEGGTGTADTTHSTMNVNGAQSGTVSHDYEGISNFSITSGNQSAELTHTSTTKLGNRELPYAYRKAGLHFSASPKDSSTDTASSENYNEGVNNTNNQEDHGSANVTGQSVAITSENYLDPNTVFAMSNGVNEVNGVSTGFQFTGASGNPVIASESHMSNLDSTEFYQDTVATSGQSFSTITQTSGVTTSETEVK